MLISMDILAHEMKDYISYQHLRADTKLEIAFCQFLDDSVSEYSQELVYILLPKDYGVLRSLPERCNLICVGHVPEDVERFDRLNVLVIGCMNSTRVTNMVIRVLRKYAELEARIDSAFTRSESLQVIVDLATELLETPICMMNMSHNPLAMSTKLQPVGDALWDSMLDGYGYRYYSTVDVSIPKLARMDAEGTNVYNGVNNISGRYIRVYLLRRGTRGVASFGLHRHTDCSRPFERHTIQLADYFVDRLTSRLDMFSEVKFGRGNLCEQFIIDLLDGKQYSEDELRRAEKNLNLQDPSKYLLGMVLLSKPTEQTDFHFALMETVEKLLPESKCAIHNQRIIFLYPLPKSGALPERYREDLADFLARNNCLCVLSSPFAKLADMPKAETMLASITQYIDAEDDGRQIYHYCQFAQMHAIQLLSRVIPLCAACSPALLGLVEYDHTNGSDYYETFVEYLRNNCNVTQTANALHMHRNSLIYRISKIEELMGCDFNDSAVREQLLFSIRCIEFGRRQNANGK